MPAGLRAKLLFFDSKAVTGAVDKGKKRALSKIGAFVRRTARSSLRRGKKSSAVGKPPKIHSSQQPNLKTIFFSYDAHRENVIIGPVLISGKSSGTPITAALESGGTTTVVRKSKSGKRRKVRTRVKARPFMGPALEKEKNNDKLSEAFKEIM